MAQMIHCQIRYLEPHHFTVLHHKVTLLNTCPISLHGIALNQFRIV